MSWKDTIRKDAPEETVAPVKSSWRDTIQKPEPEVAATEEGPGKLESAFRGGIDFASGGFSDELGGALEAAGSVVGLRGLGETELQMPRAETPTEKTQSLLEVYKAMRDKRRGINKEAMEENPASYMAGGLAGGVASGVAGKAVAGAGRAATGLSKLPGWLANSSLGGLFGLGQSEAEDLEGMAKDTGKGALTGFGVGAASGALSKGINAGANKLKGIAENQAVESLGPMLADKRALATKGTTQAMGRELLDEGVTKFGSSPSAQAERLGPLLAKKGETIGNIRSSVDQQAKALAKAGDNLGADARRVDFDTALGKVAERTQKATKGQHGKVHATAKAVDRDAKLMSEVPMRSLEKTAETLKKLGDDIPWHKKAAEWTPEELAMAKIYKNLARQVDGKIRGFTNKFDEYQAAKDSFGLFKDGEKIANTAAMRGKGDIVPGLRHSILASGGQSNILERLPGAMALKFLGDRGHAMVAKTADTTYKLLSTSPEVLGKYNAPLTAAMKRGEKAFLATHAMLINSDPEYAEMVNKMTPEDTDG